MNNTLSLTEYFKQWMETFKKPAISSVTYVKYKNTYQHLQQYFGDNELSLITRQQYQIILNRFAETHAKRTTAGFHKQIRASVLDALDDGYIETDFTRKAIVTGRQIKKQKEMYLSYNEWQTLVKYTFNHCSSNSFNLIIYLSAITGLRFSEVLGLTVSDIDFQHHLLSINKTWDYKYHTGFQTTKNKSSVRLIDIDTQTLFLLKNVISDRHLTDLNHRLCIDYTGKTPVSATINRYLEKLCYKLNLSPISFHGLRHTHASILLFKGVNILSVSKRLGHKDINTTQNVYLHVIKEMEERETNLIMKIMNEVMTK